MVSAEEARRELARRELARRRATAQPAGAESDATQTAAAQPAKPGDGGLLRAVDDVVRGAADMQSFGFADEIAAGLGATTGLGGEFGNYSGNLAKQRARDADGGLARFGGQVAGAMMMPWSLARSIPGAVAQGIATGGLYGYGSGEGDISDRAKNAVISGAAGGAAGGLVRSAANALGTRAARATIPDNAALRRAAEAGYKAADDAGVIVKPDGIRRLGTEVVGDLADMGYHPSLQPRIGAVLSEIERLGNTNSTYKGLTVLRRIVGSAGASNDPTERAMAMRIMNRLDDYLRDIPADDLIAGDAAAASRGFQTGQDNWARMRRSEMVDTAAIKAERRAASTGAGGNLENTLRQNTRAILDNPKRSRGMTPEEIEMAEKVVRGSPAQDALRLVGKLSPTTGGLSAMMNVGATAVNPFMAIPGAVGFAAKKAAERMTERNVARLSEMIRSGGKTAQELAKLTRAGELSIPEVRRLEALAKMFGVSVPTLAAAVAERTKDAIAK